MDGGLFHHVLNVEIVLTPIPAASTVRLAHDVQVCVGRDALAGGSFVATVATTGDAIGMMFTHVPEDETH